jgi:hypothetical protein
MGGAVAKSTRKSPIVILPEHTTRHTYYTHDNGSRPFKVTVQGSSVIVHKVSNYDKRPKYDTFVAEYVAQKTFVGTSPGDGSWANGNSILVHLAGSNLRYVYIGQEVSSFKAPQEITAYYSVVGNNDVPYPVARSQDYAFFMIGVNGEGVRYTNISNFAIGSEKQWYDLYGALYEIRPAERQDVIVRKPTGLKVVSARVM